MGQSENQRYRLLVTSRFAFKSVMSRSKLFQTDEESNEFERKIKKFPKDFQENIPNPAFPGHNHRPDFGARSLSILSMLLLPRCSLHIS